METNNDTVKKDCFAYDSKRNNCRALNNIWCNYGKCNFYKNKDKAKEEAKLYEY